MPSSMQSELSMELVKMEAVELVSGVFGTALILMFLYGVFLLFRLRFPPKATSKKLTSIMDKSYKYRSRTFLPAPHCWEACEPAGNRLQYVQYCCVCAKVQEDVDKRCAVCGVAVHDECVSSVHRDCKRIAVLPHKTKETELEGEELSHSGLSIRERSKSVVEGVMHMVNPAKPADEQQQSLRSVHAHHWLDMAQCDLNTPDTPHEAPCLYCKNNCSLNFITAHPVWTCIWCQSLAHASCVYKAGKAGRCCSMGEFRRMILPPAYVIRIPEADTPSIAELPPGTPESNADGGSDDTPRSPIDALLGEPPLPPVADPLMYKILPLPRTIQPLLVFVNARSGGQLGLSIARRFRRILHPIQVVSLPETKPEGPLKAFIHIPNLNILVAGGDGTASWVMSAIDKVIAGQDADIPTPPIAMIPLGTGNDLGRVMGWAQAGFWGLESGGVDIGRVLRNVKGASVHMLDRWTITYKPRGHGVPTTSKIMNNYLGVGVDAKVALDVHHMRESHPDWFKSQAGNKLWYTGLGAGEILNRSCQNLPANCEVSVDGAKLTLPPDIEGILVLNIGSFMGGVKLWKEELAPQRQDDKLLEVVGLYGTFHLGRLQVGLDTAPSLAQGRSITIRTTTRLPMQVDGEPFEQPPSTITITHLNQAKMLKHEYDASAGPFKIMHQVIADCEEQGIITTEQHRQILAELAAKRSAGKLA